MAKQLVSPVERHVEKVVLAIAVLVLLAAVARYLVSSPNVREVDGETVTPNTVDNFVFAKAERIRERIREASTETTVPEPLLEDFEDSIAPIEPNKPWPLVAAVGVEAPFVDEAGTPAGRYKLVEVLQLVKPTIVSGRSTYSVETAGGELIFLPANWVTGSAIVDVRAQSKLQRLAYGTTRANLIYGPLDVQRRSQRADGTWSDDDWEAVEAWRSEADAPGEPDIKLNTVEGGVEIATESIRDLEEFEQRLTFPETQRELLRPVPPPVENGDVWSFPILTSCRDVLAQDDELLYPHQPPSPDPDDRYGLCGGNVDVGAEANTARRIAAWFAEGERLLQQALDTNFEDDAVRAFNTFARIVKDPDASPADRQKAERKQAEAEQAERDIRRKNRRLGRQAVRDGGGDAGDERPSRELLPIQQVWFNDTAPDSVEGGRTYQYRMRLTLMNRLVGDPAKFLNPDDATVGYVRGPWSEPSDPVAIANDVEFYLATEDSRDNEIGVKIHRWYDGVWVESRKFLFSIGDVIQGECRTPVPDLDNPTEVDHAPVVYETGAAVLDIDFERPLRERKKGQGRAGVRFGNRTKGVCAVAMIGPDGDLFERYLPVDKDNPSSRAAQARKWAPPR